MRSVRLINLSVLLAMVGPLLLTGCFFPEEFDAHITIRRDGTYSLRYQGRLTFVLAAAATKQGTVLSPKDEAELARATQEFKEDPRFKVATYEGKGRFQTVYEDEGRLTGPVYFLNREVSLISIIPREDGLIVVSGLKIKPQDAEQLELLGLDFTGTITLSTDAEISEHNGTMSARTGEMRRATWTLHSIHDPPPSAVLRPSHVSSATGAKPSSPPREPQPAATARKYISAIQEPDWKTVISLTQQYQQSLNAIKASNPQALWERLTGEFYESTQRQLESEPEGFWVDYAE